MKFFAHPTMILLLLIACGSSFHLKSQIRRDKNINPATITGKVTIKGKGVPGIVVVVTLTNSSRLETSMYQATTDQDGIYRISDVAPGSYNVGPAAPAFVVSSRSSGALLIINEGESVEDVDFGLTKGGVITGRVTTSEGRPLIEQEIALLPLDGSDQNFAILNMGVRQSWVTDDRGVYRIFGVTQGKYKISVGSEVRFRALDNLLRTFYPDVTDGSKAAVVEVTEGSELTGIDITVQTTEPEKRYTVSGRVIDGVTGRPVPNVGIAIEFGPGRMGFGGPGFVSDDKGQFILENLSPGKYTLHIAPRPTEVRADPVPFEVVEEDVGGLLLKTYRGASISGQIVFEGGTEKLSRVKPRQLLLYLQVNNENRMANTSRGVNMNQSVRIREDSTFYVGGLPSGTLNFFLGSVEEGPPKPLSILRLEREGIVLPRGFEIKDGEQVTGLNLVVNSGSGTIRGMVKVGNGELPPTGRISVWFTNSASDARSSMQLPSPLVDSRGHFVVEGLLPGTYEINATLYIQGSHSTRPSAKQQVTVTDGHVTEVTITLDLGRQPEPR